MTRLRLPWPETVEVSLGSGRTVLFSLEETDTAIIIRDEWTRDSMHVTVTNGVEHVVEALVRMGCDTSKPCVYRDTLGRWDQILVSPSGEFVEILVFSESSEERLLELIGTKRKEEGTATP
jgi:hypothetical protein